MTDYNTLPTDVVPAALKGRAIGAVFMAGFGALWMIIGLKLLRRLHTGPLLVVLAITAVLVLAAIKQFEYAKTLPSSEGAATSAQAAAIGHRFNMIFAAELIAIFVAVVVLNALRRPTLILPVVAVIVGLHFFPLARLFAAPVFYSTATAMVLSVLFAFSMRDVSRRQAAIGIGCGLILWITSATLLWS